MGQFLGEWMPDYILKVQSWLTIHVQDQNEHNIKPSSIRNWRYVVSVYINSDIY